MQEYNHHKQNSLAEGTYKHGEVLGDTRKRKTNNSLIIITIILATAAIIVSVAALIFIAKDNYERETAKTETKQEKENKKAPSAEVNEEEKQAEDVKEEKKEEPPQITKTMYVNCDTSLSLRSGPGTDSSKILSLSPGEAVTYTGEENGFAKIIYNGYEGYASLQYLSDIRPYVWNYNSTEVENFVKDVLYAYVDAINTDNVNVVAPYHKGNAYTNTINNHTAVKKTVSGEQVLSIKCYGTKRISKTRVTVIRESTIRVYNYDGTQRDAVEKYLTTVENTGNGMYVVGYQSMK